MSTEFDYQWKNLPSVNVKYNENRISEFLSFTGLDKDYLKGKFVLDAGCGNGRYTYAMQKLGAIVDSIDVSQEAINECRKVNPGAYVWNIFDLDMGVLFNYDFILCWGVLHHTDNPKKGFNILTRALKPGGRLHIMLYRDITQHRYADMRKTFLLLDEAGKLAMCKKLAEKVGDVHGWYDALNPKYNHSYTVEEVLAWYKDDYTDIVVSEILNEGDNININGKKK